MAPERRQQSEAAIARRAERLQAKRFIVIDAVLGIIREGDINPSMPKIVERSGIPERSIFRYFDDIADLTAQTITRAVGDPVAVQRSYDLGVGTLDERIDSMVVAHVDALEEHRFVAQVARQRVWLAPELAEMLDALINDLQSIIGQHFANELEARTNAHAAQVLDAITVLLSAEGFAVMRQRLGKSLDEIRAMLRTSLASLLTPA